MNAFNYKTQEWIDGEDGRLLRIEQINESLALLEGPKCLEYCRMSGIKDRQGAIHGLRTALAECQPQAPQVGMETYCHGVKCRICRVHAAGTIDVEEINGKRAWRITGLPVTAPSAMAWGNRTAGKESAS